MPLLSFVNIWIPFVSFSWDSVISGIMYLFVCRWIFFLFSTVWSTGGSDGEQQSVSSAMNHCEQKRKKNWTWLKNWIAVLDTLPGWNHEPLPWFVQFALCFTMTVYKSYVFLWCIPTWLKWASCLRQLFSLLNRFFSTEFSSFGCIKAKSCLCIYKPNICLLYWSFIYCDSIC